MNKRFLAYYSLLIVAVLTFSYLQNLYYPAVPRDTDQTAAVQQQENGSGELEESSQLEPVVTGGSENTSTVKDLPTSESVAEEGSEGPNEDEPENQSEAESPASRLYSIGSIASDGSRYLITLDTAGGSIRRVELNHRKANKPSRFKYRDLEYKGGYIGELDCVDTEHGCEVRVVGIGTPAHAVGITRGDIIKFIDDEPIVTAEDFVDVLGDTKPGNSISLVFSRNGSDQTVSVELTNKPIELIRPEQDILDMGWKTDSSFTSSLRVPSIGADVWAELDPSMMNGNWKLENQLDQSISFSYLIGEETLTKNEFGIKGPLKFTKTYSLVPSGQANELNKHFHFLLKLKIENLSDQQQKICYQLNGPTGTPTETWWYQNKIHGRNWAIGYVAGARDLVGSTAQEEFEFYGGPEVVDNLTESFPSNYWLLEPPVGDSSDHAIKYLSVDTQYFNVALLPQASDTPFTAYSVLADATNVEIPKNVREQKLVDCTFRMFKIVDFKPQQSYEQTFEIFGGPKEAGILAKYGLDDVRSFGWFAMFSKPLCWLLQAFHWLTFKLGYGLPIILLTVLVRSLMIPVSRKAALNAQMMQYLQPQMKELADKYKDDMEKRGQAQRDLFRKYNYNPFNGCLMGLIQIPIFIGLYRGLSVDIALRDQPLFPGLGWCSNLSAPDQLWYWKDSLPGFLSFLTSETGFLGPYLNVLPIITCVLFIVQQKLFMPPPTDEQQEMMQKVMKYAMIFMGVMFFKVPAGLCLYFITSSLWGIIERKMLPKPELDKTKLDNISGGSSSQSAKQAKKNAADEQKRRDNVDEKKRRDKERKKKLKRS